VSLASLLGLAVSDATTNNIILVATGFVTVVMPTALVVADAAIRRARANNAETILRTREQYATPPEPYVG
jgi:F0F1-type ATP synthase epsilon subunit